VRVFGHPNGRRPPADRKSPRVSRARRSLKFHYLINIAVSGWMWQHPPGGVISVSGGEVVVSRRAQDPRARNGAVRCTLLMCLPPVRLLAPNRQLLSKEPSRHDDGKECVDVGAQPIATASCSRPGIRAAMILPWRRVVLRENPVAWQGHSPAVEQPGSQRTPRKSVQLRPVPSGHFPTRRVDRKTLSMLVSDAVSSCQCPESPGRTEPSGGP